MKKYLKVVELVGKGTNHLVSIQYNSIKGMKKYLKVVELVGKVQIKLTDGKENY
ncbi:MAG: hypothetical protein K6E95_01040 [Lachnospiraceae bacterium]|nr:hypothetical protein [Lachnospiraceae bacterium]